jgi:Lon protease-like protein
VYPVGCAGFITHADRLADGRYNILLRGLEKFRILQERRAREGADTYRVARVESIVEALAGRGGSPSGSLSDARRRLERLIAKRLQRTTDETIPKDIGDGDLVHAIAQHLEPLEKQALLECDGLLHRCHTLIELLEMRMMATSPAGKTQMH